MDFTEDYDEIDFLIDNDTIELGRRYRQLLRKYEALEVDLANCRSVVTWLTNGWT